MVDPVVSSRFGKRPLLEVPAMHVTTQPNIEVPTLQPTNVVPVSTNPFPSAPNPMLGAGTYNPMPVSYTAGGLPPAPMVMGGYERRHHSAPQMMPNPYPRPFYYGPNGETIIPPPNYMGPPMYPGVMGPPPVRIPYPPYGGMAGFNVTCELEYGRVVNINVREADGNFRGIPDFLRTEMMRTYGQYPYTEVRVKLEGGEFHIYATHEHRPRHRRRRHRHRDSDSDSDEEDEELYRHGLPDWKSEVDSYTSGVRPRAPNSKPRGIIRERGWNRYR